MGPQGVGPRHDWAEAELLAEGFAANLATLRALQQCCRFTNDQAATVCGVSKRTYRRWLRTGKPTPGAVRLLAILAGFVPWDGWDGWEVHRGCFFPPGFTRGGISPGEFQALVFWRQQVHEYKRQNAALRAQLADLEALSQATPGRVPGRPSGRVEALRPGAASAA